MYSYSTTAKCRAQKNVRRIDLNDTSERERRLNNTHTVQKVSNLSPISGHTELKSPSNYQDLYNQLYPSTTHSSKNYSQQKQALLNKKNEIIKGAIKQNLLKKVIGNISENRGLADSKMYTRYDVEINNSSMSKVKSRERINQTYDYVKNTRPSSAIRQHKFDVTIDLNDRASPKNRSYMHKKYTPIGTADISEISNLHDMKTANTTIIKYPNDHRDSNSYMKDRSFDVIKENSSFNKHTIQNRILLDLDESSNISPKNYSKLSITPGYGGYIRSKDEFRNRSPISYQQTLNSSLLNSRKASNLQCKIMKDSDEISALKENPVEKYTSNLDVTATIKLPINKLQTNYSLKDILAYNPDPQSQHNQTGLNQRNLNCATPTSSAKPPLADYALRTEESASKVTESEIRRRTMDHSVKYKNLNVQTSKENKAIEFPQYLQNYTYDRSKAKNIIAKHAAHMAGMQEKITRKPQQSSELNNTRVYQNDKSSVEHLRENRLSRERHLEVNNNNTSSNYNDNSALDSANGNRSGYADSYKRSELQNYGSKVSEKLRCDQKSMKNTLDTSENNNSDRNKTETVGLLKINELLSGENRKSNVVRENSSKNGKNLDENNEIANRRGVKNPVQPIQVTNPVMPPSSRRDTPQEKDNQQSKSTDKDKDVLSLEPVERESKIKKFKEEFVIGRQIGQGAYAIVRAGIHKPTNTKVAIKIYEKSKIMDPMRKRSVRREIKLMQRINHPNVIKIWDVVETNNHLNIIMEYVGGVSLHSFLKSQPNRRLKDEQAYGIFKQIMAGINYCHTRCIAHRDVKLENMLLDEEGNLKIIDFGFSTCIPNDKKVKMFCGTPSYMSPEIVSRVEYCGPPVDVWAAGVLLYALLCGTFPFKGTNDKELYSRITKGDYAIPEYISDNASALLRKMMNVDPDKRLEAKEVLNEPWCIMHAFLEKKSERRGASRSSCSLDKTVVDKLKLGRDYPSNLETNQSTPKQTPTHTNYQTRSHTPDIPTGVRVRNNDREHYYRENDGVRDSVRCLSSNVKRNVERQTPTEHNIYNRFNDISRNVIAANLRDKDNDNGNKSSYKEIKGSENLAVDENFEANKSGNRNAAAEIEIWNVPTNISSDKSFRKEFGKVSRSETPSNVQNNPPEDRQDNYDPYILKNLMKMGYNDEEINHGLREKRGTLYLIYKRMANEKKALQENDRNPHTVDPGNSKLTNSSSNAALLRKQLNFGYKSSSHKELDS